MNKNLCDLLARVVCCDDFISVHGHLMYVFSSFFIYSKMTSIREHREYSSNVVRDLNSRPLSPYQTKFGSQLGRISSFSVFMVFLKFLIFLQIYCLKIYKIVSHVLGVHWVNQSIKHHIMFRICNQQIHQLLYVNDHSVQV